MCAGRIHDIYKADYECQGDTLYIADDCFRGMVISFFTFRMDDSVLQ